jgi:hypothetical protein
MVARPWGLQRPESMIPSAKNMSGKEKERLLPAIDRKLAALVRSSEEMPSWHDHWAHLGPQSTAEERFGVCQAIRNSSFLPEDAGFFLVCWAAENIADDSMSSLSNPLDTLNIFESCCAFDRVFIDVLQKHDESTMAEQFQTGRQRHDLRREAGRLFFFKPIRSKTPDPAWLDGLLRAVAGCLIAARPIGGLAYRYRGEEFLEIDVLPVDEERQGWAMDIERLRGWFSRINGCGWYAMPREGEMPYFWIEGKYDRRDIFLRLLPTAQVADGYQIWQRTST